jgi:hypothetical protein
MMLLIQVIQHSSLPCIFSFSRDSDYSYVLKIVFVLVRSMHLLVQFDTAYIPFNAQLYVLCTCLVQVNWKAFCLSCIQFVNGKFIK